MPRRSAVALYAALLLSPLALIAAPGAADSCDPGVTEPGLIATYRPGALLLRADRGEKSPALAARWAPGDGRTDATRAARLEPVDRDEIVGLGAGPWVPVPVRARVQWDALVGDTLREFAPTANGEAALLVLQGDEFAFFVTADGVLRIQPHESKPADRKVRRVVDEAEFAERAAARVASLALVRASRPPWAPAFTEALAATSQLVDGATLVGATHPAGVFTARVDESKRCEGCAWAYTQGSHLACRQVDSVTVGPNHRNIEPHWPACDRFEPALDCQPCGACCREAFQTVPVGAREPIRSTLPAMVLDHGTSQELRRVATVGLDIVADKPAPTRCAALGGGDLVQVGARLRVSDYACQIYQARPRACRSFTASSESCLVARRRVGMSR